jgi:hypothetical protein
VICWRKQEDAFLQTTNKLRKAFQGPKSGKFLELEDEMLLYIWGLHDNGACVLHEILYLKAYVIATSKASALHN